MITYVVYTVVAIILVFVIYIAIKAVNQGVEAKNKPEEENLNFEDNVDKQNIADSLLKLNDFGALFANEIVHLIDFVYQLSK